MAKSTYQAMVAYGKLKCKCNPNPWDDSWDNQIRNFARIRTRFPRVADVDGNVFGDLTIKPLGYPESIRLKALILDVPLR